MPRGYLGTEGVPGGGFSNTDNSTTIVEEVEVPDTTSPQLPSAVSTPGNFSIVNTYYSIGQAFGGLVGTYPSFGSAVWPFAGGGAIIVPFWVPANWNVKLLWCFNGATAAGNSSMAIFEEDGNNLVNSTNDAQAGVNVIQTFNITDTSLVAGEQYWLGLAHSEGTGTFMRISLVGLAQGACLGVDQTTGTGDFGGSDWTTYGGFLGVANTASYIPLMGFSTNASF